MGNIPRVYALYKGDMFLDVGTISEMAERQGIKTQTLYHYRSISYRRRCDERGIPYEGRYVLIEVEDDDD